MKRKMFRSLMLFALAAALAAPLLGQSRPNPRRNNGIKYHGGQVMLFRVSVYFIWYGNWTGSDAPQAVTNFMVSVGGSDYSNINTTYYDGTGTHATNALLWGLNIVDQYSRGANLSGEDVQAIVAGSISTGQLPLDPHGLYIVMGSGDVSAPGLCNERCQFHESFFYPAGVTVRYAFVSDPQRCPSSCASQFVDSNRNMILQPPSGDYSIDAMISWVAHVINGAFTNPDGDGWFDNRGRENSDKCQMRFGATYTTANGGTANIRLNGRDYLLPQNWVNADGGYCSLAYP